MDVLPWLKSAMGPTQKLWGPQPPMTSVKMFLFSILRILRQLIHNESLDNDKKLVHVLCYDILGRHFGMKIYYDFSQFFVKFILRQIKTLKRLRDFIIKIPQQFVLFFWLGRKKKVNKFSWHHPKLTDEIIVQKGHEQV